MTAPNLFLIYVTDIPAATLFYSRLFEITPAMETPRYVAFEAAPGVLFSLWSGKADSVSPEVTRTSEVGMMVPGGRDAVDALYPEWIGKGATRVEAPYDEVFGRTFVVADPDGNLIRVSPID